MTSNLRRRISAVSHAEGESIDDSVVEDTLEIEGAEAEQEMDFNEDQESECKKEHEYDIAVYT